MNIKGVELKVGDLALVVSGSNKFRAAYNLGVVKDSNGRTKGGSRKKECLSLEKACSLVFENYLGFEIPAFRMNSDYNVDTDYVSSVVLGVDKIIEYLESHQDSRYKAHARILRNRIPLTE